MMTKRVYRFSWAGRLFLVLTTGGWLWGVWFVEFGTPISHNSIWMVLGWVILSLMFCWGTAMSLIGQIVVDEDGLTYHNLFFHRRHVPWSEIKCIRSDFTAPVGGEGITLRVYNVVNYHNRTLVMIGPSWIAHYKDLLRDILAHVPDDAQTDVHVYHAIRRRGETAQEAYRVLGRQRQEVRSHSTGTTGGVPPRSD